MKKKRILCVGMVGLSIFGMTGCFVQDVYTNSTKSIISPFDIKKVELGKDTKGGNEDVNK